MSHRCKTDWYRLNALKLSSNLGMRQGRTLRNCMSGVGPRADIYDSHCDYSVAGSIVGMIGGDRIDCIAESSTVSRLGPIPKFVQSNAELPFVIEREELRGSGTLVNSAANFHDVTRGAALALRAA